MASFTRRNAWNNDGTFANLDLLWYAKGVRVMQSRALDDPNSWWFFAAMHGQYITTNNDSFPGWGFLASPPQVPTTPLPSQAIQDQYWDQCQHQSWFFAPWHRGYLIALEAQIRAAISPDGPPDWALPYWNYLGPDPEFRIPPAFTTPTLPDPDGGPNPLFVKARYGPDFQRPGDIFVIKDTSGTPATPNGVNAFCQNGTAYTGFNTVTPSPGYGGPPTGFWHGQGTSGNLEQNPHNMVHVNVGGNQPLTFFSVGLQFVNELDAGQLSPALKDAFQQNGIALSSQAQVVVNTPGNIWRLRDEGLNRRFVILNNQVSGMLDVDSFAQADVTGGLMSDPGTAALDPIFYLHHCNIDRLWAAWNANGNSNLTDQFWVNGPAVIGQQGFVMPMPPDGAEWVYTPAQVESLGLLDYGYDELDGTVAAAAPEELAQRLMKLAAAPAAMSAAQGANMGGGDDVELLGANDGALQITGSGARTTVRLDADVRGKVFASLARASEANAPDRTYLHLENVRGTMDAFELNVTVNQQHVGTVSLFGLRRSSAVDGRHGGMGLNFIFDVTDVMDNLFVGGTPDADSLDVRITPNNVLADVAEITVGRISIYRRGAAGQ